MKSKKLQRDEFRFSVLQRDKCRCVICEFSPSSLDELDVHHICDRNKMPFGGYTTSNGISLCTDRTPGSSNCHRKAESFHETGIIIPGYTPSNLYAKIKSSHWEAYHKCIKEYLNDRSFAVLLQQFRHVLAEELAVCLHLECDLNETTWLLACETIGVNDPLILIYGEGRLYASDAHR